jgi:hypothetical protein
MALSVRVEAFLKRLAAKGDVYALGILEAIKGEKGAGGGRYEKVLTNPAAASANGCVTAKAGTLANNSLAIADGTPDFPRCVTCTFGDGWDGGDITITGIDHTGLAATETILDANNTTVVGVVAWREITSVSKEAVGINAATVAVGYNDKFGLGAKPLCFANGVGELGTLDATNGTIDPNTAANGAVDYVLSAVKA